MKALQSMTQEDLERIIDRDYPMWFVEFADQYDLGRNVTGQLSEEALRERVSRRLIWVLSAAYTFTQEEEEAGGAEAGGAGAGAREADER